MTKDEWLAKRKGGISASDSPPILGVGYISALELYSLKLGLIEDRDSHQKRRGRALEGAVLSLAEEEVLGPRGWTLDRPEPFTLVTHRTLPWMMATPDAYYVTKKGQRGLVQAKSRQWEPMVEAHAGPTPADYAQCQHEMEVTGLDSCLLVVLIGGMALKHTLIGRDGDFIGRMLIAEERFRERLEHKNPPPPDDSDGAARALAALYPEVTETVIELDDEAEEAWRALEGLRKQSRGIEKARRGAGNFLRSLMQHHQYALLPSGTLLERLTYTQKIQARTVTRIKSSSLYSRQTRSRSGARSHGSGVQTTRG